MLLIYKKRCTESTVDNQGGEAGYIKDIKLSSSMGLFNP
jgi:hypothetical protein